MDGAGANMCKAINIEGVAVKATYASRVCVGGKVVVVADATFVATVVLLL